MKFKTEIFRLWWLYWALGQTAAEWTRTCAEVNALLDCHDHVLQIISISYGQSRDCGKDIVGAQCDQPADSDYVKSIKGKCNGQHNCSFKAQTASIVPSGKCQGLSNYMAMQFQCIAVDTLIDVCSAITTDTREALFVSPGFPSQINTTDLSSECNCVLATQTITNFYLYAYSYHVSEDCSGDQQLLKITYEDKNKAYTYTCTNLQAMESAQILSQTKHINIQFEPSLNRGRFWIFIRDQAESETIHISCNSQVSSPPVTAVTTTDPGSEADGTTDTVLWAVIGGVGGVLLLIIIVVIIWCRKRRRRPVKEKAVRFDQDGNKVSVIDEEDYPEDHTYAEVSDRVKSAGYQQGAETGLKPVMNPNTHNEYMYAYSRVPDDNKNTADFQGAYAYADVPRNGKNYSQAPDEDTSNQPANPSGGAPTYAVVNKQLKNDEVELIENSLYEADVTAKKKETIPADVELVENDLYE